MEELLGSMFTLALPQRVVSCLMKSVRELISGLQAPVKVLVSGELGKASRELRPLLVYRHTPCACCLHPGMPHTVTCPDQADMCPSVSPSQGAAQPGNSACLLEEQPICPCMHAA